MKDDQVRILLVEDDDVDVMAVQRALGKMRVVNDLHVARDGIEALEVLRGTNGQEALLRPYIILLDLNMPRMGGLEFLAEIRKDPSFQDTVIFVMTTSSSDEDMCLAYAHSIAGYVLKTNISGGFSRAIEMLDLYWKVVELPK